MKCSGISHHVVALTFGERIFELETFSHLPKCFCKKLSWPSTSWLFNIKPYTNPWNKSKYFMKYFDTSLLSIISFNFMLWRRVVQEPDNYCACVWSFSKWKPILCNYFSMLQRHLLKILNCLGHTPIIYFSAYWIQLPSWHHRLCKADVFLNLFSSRTSWYVPIP